MRTSKAIVDVVDHDRGAYLLKVTSSSGETIEAALDVTQAADGTLILSGVHLQGTGPGQLGRSGIKEVIQGIVDTFGKAHGVEQVRVVFGARYSGAHPDGRVIESLIDVSHD